MPAMEVTNPLKSSGHTEQWLDLLSRSSQPVVNPPSALYAKGITYLPNLLNNFSLPSWAVMMAVTSLNAQNPSPDSFNPGVDGVVASIVVQAESKIFLGSDAGRPGDPHVDRLNADGASKSANYPIYLADTASGFGTSGWKTAYKRPAPGGYASNSPAASSH